MKNNNLKVAVLGAGYWGKNLVRNFHALGALGMIVDSSPDVLAGMNKTYPGINIKSSYLDAINNPEIKGIVISTPAETHGFLALEAILAGKDVFVEKPLCLSEDEAEEIIRAADEKGCILMVGHLLWYHPAIRKLQDLIQDGELGRIQYIYSHRLNMGKLRREENVLWSFAPHDVSMILGLTEEMPESVYAQGGNYLHKKISDVTVSLLSFPSGIEAHIFVSWLHPFKEQKLVVVGERKMAVFNDTLPWEEKLVLYPHQVEWHGNIPIAVKAEAQNIVLSQEEPLRAECTHFLECMAQRKRPVTDGREGLSVLRVLNACQRSLELKRSETISSIHASEGQIFVHPTAVVDPVVTLGAGTKIWHFSHILSGSVVGEGCNIGQNVVIGPGCRIGKGCKIQNNVSVYEGVTLEDFVFCGPSAVFTNVYNPRAEIPRMKELRSTLVKKGATIGANSTIVCGVTLGSYSFVGAGAVVTRDVPDYALVVGNPARKIGWICMCGDRIGDDFICPACGKSYEEKESGLKMKKSA